MKRMTLLVPLLLLFAFLLAHAEQQPESKSLAFTHVTVIDVSGGPAKPDMTVVITGDRIAAIGSADKLRIPNDARVINASGKFLIPGLWDMHAHIIGKGFLSLFVANGVTGVRDMGGYWEMLKPLREQITNGTLIGPRIMAAGPIVDGPKPVWPFSVATGDESQGRQAVISLKQRGVDFIKVYSLLPRDAYFAIADEAKKQGMTFAGHVPRSVTVTEASDAGQKSIEHLDQMLLACSAKESELRKELAEERAKSGASAVPRPVIRARAKQLLATYDGDKARALFARLAKNGTWQVPTLTVLRAISSLDDPEFTSDARLKYLAPSVKQWWNPKDDPRFKDRTAEDAAIGKENFQNNLQIVGVMRRAGVEFLAGTDTPNPYCFPGFSIHDELKLLVKAGLTPMEALQAATRNPAKYFGLLDTAGTIERGKIADLVLLDANPLQDIGNTEKINAVIVKGRLLDRKALDSILAEIESAANR